MWCQCFPIVLVTVALLLLPAGLFAAPPPFTPAEELAAVHALVGPVARGTVRDGTSATGTPNSRSGFLDADGAMLYEVLLSRDYVEGPVSRHVVVLGGHRVAAGELVRSHVEGTDIAAAVFEARQGRWVLTLTDPEVATLGSDGDSPEVELTRIGVARHALRVRSAWMGLGVVMSRIDLHVLDGPPMRSVLGIALAASDCGTGRQPCARFTVSMSVDEQAGPGAYDIVLTIDGDYRDEQDRIVGMPPVVRLRLTDGEYQPVGRDARLAAAWKALREPY
jgi:hypothetical protein